MVSQESSGPQHLWTGSTVGGISFSMSLRFFFVDDNLALVADLIGGNLTSSRVLELVVEALISGLVWAFENALEPVELNSKVDALSPTF